MGWSSGKLEFGLESSWNPQQMWFVMTQNLKWTVFGGKVEFGLQIPSNVVCHDANF